MSKKPIGKSNIDKFLTHLRESINNFGFWGGLRYQCFFLYYRTFGTFGHNNLLGTLTYCGKGGGKRIYYRPFTSDTPLLHTIFTWDKEYDIDVDSEKFDSILDLGANIGLFSVLYSTRFPQKKIIAVEPEKNNYRLLRRNLADNEFVKTYKTGIWWRKASLKLIDSEDNWGFTVEEVQQGEDSDFKGIDIDTICKKERLQGNLLVKMDIEGTEKVIFEHISEAEWIDKTSYLIIEIHEGEDSDLYNMICEEMGKRGFNKEQKGENVVFSRENDE